MANFDLAKTEAVLNLLASPGEARDDAWGAAFQANVLEASFASPPQQLLDGPDGFPYFALMTPPTATPFTAFSVAHVLEHCTSKGCGIVINPAAQPPSWVFSYGDLWSLRAYGRLDGDPSDELPLGQSGAQPAPAGEILVGAPSEAFLPTWARAVLRSYLQQAVGLADPRVCLVIHPALRPTRSLVFNLFVDGPPLRMPFQEVLSRLSWFLPSRRGLLAFNQATLAPESFLAL